MYVLNVDTADSQQRNANGYTLMALNLLNSGLRELFYFGPNQG
jgi:hypothetical protein